MLQSETAVPAGWTYVQPRSSVCVTTISLGLMINACRHAFGLKQEAHLRWTRERSLINWKEFVRCLVRANETYSEAKHQFSDRNIALLENVQSPHKWWATLSQLCSARVRHCLCQ